MIVEVKDLRDIRSKFKNKKIVFAGGTWDLFHPGHVRTFEYLKGLGDVLVIAVSTDKRVKERKGDKRPIMSEEERVEMVNSMRWVDYALIAPPPEKGKPVPTMQILSKLQPDIFTSSDERWKKYEDKVSQTGAKLKIVARISDYSTTKMIKRVLDRYQN